jgi:hypothetical protein
MLSTLIQDSSINLLRNKKFVTLGIMGGVSDVRKERHMAGKHQRLENVKQRIYDHTSRSRTRNVSSSNFQAVSTFFLLTSSPHPHMP